jgi:hypothetical protein
VSSSRTKQMIMRIPLDDRGCPKRCGPSDGNPHSLRICGGALEMLAEPKVRKELWACSSRFVKGKLYIGTKHSGLLIFDTKTKKWEIIDPSKGLPCWNVDTLHHWKDGLLLCYGREIVKGSYARFRYSFNPTDGTILVLQKQNRDKRLYVYGPYREVWDDKGELCGIGRSGLARNILANKPKHRRLPQINTTGWSKLSTGYRMENYAVVGQRIFTEVPGGLLELDFAGKVKDRIFMGRGAVLPGFEEHWYSTELDVPGDAPGSGWIVSDGRYLWFTTDTVLFDPQEKQWYGPLIKHRIPPRHSIATSGGLWTSGDQYMSFIDREKYITAAVNAGRAVQSQQYIRLRDIAIAKLPAVPRARYLLALRRLDEAEDVLDAHLKEHSDDPLAILLMGMVQDSWGKKDLKRADACYRKLMGMKDRKVSFTGMYMILHQLVHQKKWSEAQTLAKRIRSEFPVIREEYEKDITRLDQRIGKASEALKGN